MHTTLLLLGKTDFSPLRRDRVGTLQVNLGCRCNQSCLHCHVGAKRIRTGEMGGATADMVVEVLRMRSLKTLGLTGRAPQLHARFRCLVRVARALGVTVIDRCNSTILSKPGEKDLAQFLAVEFA